MRRKFFGEPALFSEDQARAVVTCRAADLNALLKIASSHGVPANPAGETGGDHLELGETLRVSLGDLHAAWEGTP